MRPFLLLIWFVLIHLTAYSQGCSDAGFCTMGAMKPDQPFNKKIALKLRSMELSFYRGTTTLTPIVYVATADMNFSLNRKTTFKLSRLLKEKSSMLSGISISLPASVFIAHPHPSSPCSEINKPWL